MLNREIRRIACLVPAAAACLFCLPAGAANAVNAAKPASEANAAAEAAPGAESQSAVWTPKEINFVYLGFTTKYSCDGLLDKVRGVLLDLGAEKKGLKVAELGCSSPFGRPDLFPGVRVHMQVLQPANGSADAHQPPVAAHWKPVDLKLSNSFSNDSGECELMEQIHAKIVPLFTTRNVDLKATCIPYQESAARPILKLEVLTADKQDDKAGSPADKATSSAGKAPSAGA